MTCARCEALEREVARLRKAAAVPLIRQGLCLTSETHARIVARLHRAEPAAWVAAHDLELEMPSDWSTENAIRVNIMRIRHRVGGDFIETAPAGERSYRLTEAGRSTIDIIMAGGHPADEAGED